jgi:hypothetical protein
MQATKEAQVLAVGYLGCCRVAFYEDGSARLFCCPDGMTLTPDLSWPLLRVVARTLERGQFQQVRQAICRALDPSSPSHWQALREMG